MHAELDPFLQSPPAWANRWRRDRALRQALARLLPDEEYAAAAAEADRVAERGVTEMLPLARQAGANPPRHVPYDAWGARVDRIEVDPAWRRLVALGQELGLVALAYERPYGARSRIVQAVLNQLVDPVSATALCPLTMTDAAAAALLRHDPALAERYVPRLVARRDGWTSGQWMTEKEGGSDVGRSGTTARPLGDGTWALRGTKWFTSATTADMAVALARPEGAEAGSRGLSLFALELRRPDGSWNGLRVRRLKDKLGTRALPTAELDLDGTVAVPVGGIGRGVPKVGAVLTVARIWAAQAGVGVTGQALALARDYAGRREVLGAPLSASALHTGWLAEIAATYEAMLALSLRAAELAGSDEAAAVAGVGPLTRLVVPLAKLATARQGVWATSQLLESFGGAGYLEDTGLPGLLRDVHVQCIWEGTSNVLALDVLRALRDPATGAAFTEDVAAQLAAYPHPATDDAAERVRAAAGELRPLLASAATEPDPGSARRLAWGMARTYQAALLVAQAGWAAKTAGDERSATAARLFAARPLLAEVPPAGGAELAALALDEREEP
jgi:alkylation response protein AidB-like acyl-CoA dehydrogenase